MESEIPMITQDEANALRYAAGCRICTIRPEEAVFQEARYCGISIISG